MNNVVEMVPNIGLDEEQKAAVLACGKRIRADKITLRKVSMSIGYDSAFIENLADRGSWRLLGYEDQHEFRKAEGLGRSNWYRVLSIAKNFLQIDRETYISMTLENAERLSVEPEEVRFDPENISKAADMTAEEFDDHITTVSAHREGKPKHERWVQIHIRLRAQQRKVIQTALESWKKEHGIDDDAFALETLVMEYAERPTLAGFILESIPRLSGTISAATDISELKSQLTTYLQEMAEIVHVVCGAVEEEMSA